MLLYQNASTGSKVFFFFALSSPKPFIWFNSIIFISLACLHLSVMSQPRGDRSNIKKTERRIIQIPANGKLVDSLFYKDLADQTRQAAARFRSFLAQKGMPEVVLPFSPVTAINHGYFKEDTLQVWIAKRTLQDRDDYMLLIFKAGKPVVCEDSDVIEDFKKASVKITECTMVELSRFNGGQAATYSTIKGKQIEDAVRYMTTFQNYLKKYKMRPYFPYTFILRPLAKHLGQSIQIKASVRSTKANTSSISKNNAFFAGYHGNDLYVLLNSDYDEVCCQCPPE